MTFAEHSYPKNMMAWDSLLPFFCIPFWKHKENGAPQNKKHMEFIMPSLNGNYYLQGADIIARNDHKPLNKFLNGKMQITRSMNGGWS